MLLLVDRSFSGTGDNLGALDGCIDFANIIGESYDILTINILGPGVAAGLANDQFDAARILDAYEPTRRITNDRMVILTSLDLTAHTGSQWLNFIFGLSRTGESCITSTYRFAAAELRPDLARQANRLIAMHELGHVWGLVPDDSPRADGRSGIYTGHCTARCTMQQVVSVHEATALAAELSNESFCTDCRHYLTS